jgi:hypothetical protein
MISTTGDHEVFFEFDFKGFPHTNLDIVTEGNHEIRRRGLIEFVVDVVFRLNMRG